jgi:hemolysin III
VTGLAVEALAVEQRPKLRGVLHAVAFVASCFVGAAFVAAAPDSRALAAAVFATSASVTLGTSALYHRVSWSRAKRLWMRRADHAGVYLLIAGTYTPVGLISLHGAWRTSVLAIVWAGAADAIAAILFSQRKPPGLSAD